ncbi:RagB/SusD family nutrient uptake outer membrane protein [Pedobacter nototheniae]|uniref:RagB/SusD family nutrient uptake outer membrane protein n=1 Tax=Pedobacter nototheniae TaxID=2488994 RepID=UPI00103AA69C|nr:RagB/SusD family nutrient uptake outer membrane protein [Pedobacter nototheniae]
MKKIYIVALFLLIGSAFMSSCKKELNQQPDGSLLDETAITDFQTLQAATMGCYNSLTDLNWYGRNYPTMLELRGSNMFIAASNSNRLRPAYQYNFTVADADVSETWNTLYKAIVRANNVIIRSSVVKDGDATEVARLIAEAKFVRAMAYFDLTRVFGQPYYVGNGSSLSVPIVLTSSITQPKRNTVAEVYAQIIKDLTEAKPALPTDLTDKFRASRFAASALLARVYLYKGDAASNALAITEATNVIGAGYTMTTASSYAGTIFWANPGQGEEIFTAKISQFQDLGSDNYGQLYVKELGGYGDIRVNPAFRNSYDDADVRKTQVIKVDATAGNYITTKFYKQDNIPGLYSPKLLRLSEMYFIRAEANVKLGTSTGATPASDLSAVRTMRGLAAYTGTPTLANVLAEKNLEFAFEGFQWPDNFRNGLPIARPQISGALSNNASTNIAVTDNKQLYPIPQREVDANPNIKPNNPGY